MAFPGVKLHQLYSLHLYDGLDVIFEDLKMVDYNALQNVKNKPHIQIVPNILSINTDEKCITIVGHTLNDSTFIVNREGRGDIITISYKCSNEDIIMGIEYLYQIYKNLIIKSEDKFDNKWNPKPYRPNE